MMEWKLGAAIHSSDGHKVGTLDRLIVDQATNSVVSLVMRGQNTMKPNVMIGLHEVAQTEAGKVVLALNRQEAFGLTDFVEQEFVQTPPRTPHTDTITGPSMPYMISPARDQVDANATVTTAVEHAPVKHMSATQVDIKRGAKVMASDGEIGIVEGLEVDPATGRVTSLIVRKGAILPQRTTVPTELISKLGEDVVQLIAPQAELPTDGG